MTQQSTEFAYHNIQLYKSESLGRGSYGGVCKARCDGLLCAAKIMHPTFFDANDPGTPSYVCKFQEECHLLSLARHPNVVQYLATYTDPDTQLPVLLMELCNESLTAFLERSSEPLSYHIQVNICHDIALALVYLHSNGLIHRDLTGNNVLIVAGPRAKITDFGMSKLATVNPRMTLTQCPGNLLYMSPEALDEAKSYSAKLDIFSFGVLVVQILTKLFPCLTDRFRNIHVDGIDREIREIVPEIERRHTHLTLIPDTHSLKPLALDCLKQQENERPSALQLSGKLFELKKAIPHVQSRIEIYQGNPEFHDQKCSTWGATGEQQTAVSQQLERKIEAKERQLQLKESQIQEQWYTIQAMHKELQVKHHTDVEGREKGEQQGQITELERRLEEMDSEIRTKDVQLQHSQQNMERAIAVSDQELERKESELQKMQEQLEDYQQVVSEFSRSTQQKDQHISSLKEIISAQERKLGQLEQQEISGKLELQQKNETIAELRQTISAQEAKIQQLEEQDVSINTQTPQQQVTSTLLSGVPKDISRKKWRKGKNAPEAMYRGAAVGHGNTAYFRPAGSNRLYSFNLLRKERWSRMPENNNLLCGLAVIDGYLTSVGGRKNDACIETLLSLRGGEWKQWSEIFPPMPTPRCNTACVTTALTLVVAGGQGVEGALDTVEVMGIATKQWTKVSSLPQKCLSLSAALCGDALFCAVGFKDPLNTSRSVFSCSLCNLLPPTTFGISTQQTFSPSSNVWSEISSLPVRRSVLVMFSGHLLAIGGRDDAGTTNSLVYRYDFHTNSWTLASQMMNKRSLCLAVTLPEDKLIVVGGLMANGLDSKTSTVEIFE